jgi:hypothetical protein
MLLGHVRTKLFGPLKHRLAHFAVLQILKRFYVIGQATIAVLILTVCEETPVDNPFETPLTLWTVSLRLPCR